jgi:hypothetical protein
VATLPAMLTLELPGRAGDRLALNNGLLKEGFDRPESVL